MKTKISMTIKVNYEMDLPDETNLQITRITNKLVETCNTILKEEGTTVEILNIKSA